MGTENDDAHRATPCFENRVGSRADLGSAWFQKELGAKMLEGS